MTGPALLTHAGRVLAAIALFLAVFALSGCAGVELARCAAFASRCN